MHGNTRICVTIAFHFETEECFVVPLVPSQAVPSSHEFRHVLPLGSLAYLVELDRGSGPFFGLGLAPIHVGAGGGEGSIEVGGGKVRYFQANGGAAWGWRVVHKRMFEGRGGMAASGQSASWEESRIGYHMPYLGFRSNGFTPTTGDVSCGLGQRHRHIRVVDSFVFAL